MAENREEIGHGRLASLVGAGSRLEGDPLEDLLSFISLEIMRRAAEERVSGAGLRVLRHVLLRWSRQRKASPYALTRVIVRASDLRLLDHHAAQAGIASLASVLPVTSAPEAADVLTIDFAPWLSDDDIALMNEFEQVWLWRHVAAVQDACQHAEATIDLYLGPDALEDLPPHAMPRMTRLREDWTDLRARLTWTRPDHSADAVRDPWAFHEQVAELERLHDAVVGLLTDPEMAMQPFGWIWKQEGSAKLQALGLPPRSPPSARPELRVVAGSAH